MRSKQKGSVKEKLSKLPQVTANSVDDEIQMPKERERKDDTLSVRESGNKKNLSRVVIEIRQRQK